MKTKRMIRRAKRRKRKESKSGNKIKV